MAAPDTRYSARQFNFNQRMVLMILLYISRNGVGDKRINLACRSCCLGLKSYLEAACPNNHWMPYYQLFVAVLGLLLMMVAHWLVVFQAVPRWVCAAGHESCCSWSRWDYPCCCHEVRPAAVVEGFNFDITVHNCDPIRSGCLHARVHLPHRQHHRGGRQGCAVHLRGQQSRRAQGQLKLWWQ